MALKKYKSFFGAGSHIFGFKDFDGGIKFGLIKILGPGNVLSVWKYAAKTTKDANAQVSTKPKVAPIQGIVCAAKGVFGVSLECLTQFFFLLY